MGTGLMVHFENWNQEKQLCVYARKGNLTRQQADENNLLLSGIMNRIQAVYFKYRLQNAQLDVETFKEQYGTSGTSRSYHDFFSSQVELLSNSLAHNTMKQYRMTQRLLMEFMPKFDINQLTPEVITRFDGFLRRHGFNANTRMKNHRLNKRIALMACKEYTMPNPYDEFKLKHVTGKREYLNKFEVNSLIELLATDKLNQQQTIALKKYLFSCHVGGLRISDMHGIGIDHVFDQVLVLSPQKTIGQNKIVQIPMPDNALDFVQYTEGPKFFDLQADQQINRCLKVAALHAGIKKRLTFHTSRHTFATGFLNAGGKVEVLQRILGHSDIKTTMIYIHISRERLKDEMDGIELY